MKKRLEKLRGIIISFRKAIVAYSGGVDSSFLLKCCLDYLGKDNVLAVTAVSPTYTRKELTKAKEIAKGLRVSHAIIKTEEVDNPNFRSNPRNRCYYCKTELFSRLKSIAQKKGIDFVLDGTNADDLKDYRPGRQAKEELGVRSPLAESGLHKADIRQLSRKFGLETWDAPQAACLASRFAYGQEIAPEDLGRIERAEDYLRSLGIKMARVRHYVLTDKTRLARIEVDREEIQIVTSYKLQVASQIKKLGYNYVTLDLEGYRTGSMNEGITDIV
ncbi:ATP-dependent sacrificial sulfur transferase LarE [bacterium]|nr:MAG: ATP-dependent sacrificial sulfur transferase LarE [bacterium]